MSGEKGHPWDFSHSRLYRSPYPGTAVGDSDRESERWAEYSESLEDTHYGKGPKDWRRGDEHLKEDVSEALYQHPAVDASEIDVVVEEGIVYLNGSVQNKEMKKLAQVCVESVYGVRDVFNYLKPWPNHPVPPV